MILPAGRHSGEFGRFLAALGPVDCAPQYFRALALSVSMACGIVGYHSAFNGGAAEQADSA